MGMWWRRHFLCVSGLIPFRTVVSTTLCRCVCLWYFELVRREVFSWAFWRFFHEHFGRFSSQSVGAGWTFVGANSIHLIPRWTRKDHVWNETPTKTRKDVVEATCWGHFGQIPLLKLCLFAESVHLTNSNTPVFSVWNRDLWHFLSFWSFNPKQPKRGSRGPIHLQQGGNPHGGKATFFRTSSKAPRRQDVVAQPWGEPKGLGALGGWGVGVGILWFETRFLVGKKHFHPCFL